MFAEIENSLCLFGCGRIDCHSISSGDRLVAIWKDESSLSLNLLEQNDPVLSADEVILFASNDRIQLKDESSVSMEKTDNRNWTIWQ